MIILWQKKTLLHKSFFFLKRGSVMYGVFSYFKHHIYYVSINNFLEQHVYNNMLFMSLILDLVILGMS